MYNQKKYSKNLFKKIVWACVSGLGFLLILEHWFVWGRLDFFDFLGHEWLGFILLLIDLWGMTNFKWKLKVSPLKYALNKFKKKEVKK